MIKAEAASAFLELQKQLQHEGLLPGRGAAAKAALRAEDGAVFFAEFEGENITLRELESMADDEQFLRAFFAKPDAKALLLLAGVYALRVADTMRRLNAELDDMAQIAGLTARTANSLDADELARCLRHRNSCFVKDQGMLITGRSLSEALTGAILLEKAAMTHILAEKIGGAKRVPLLSAALMHLVYQKKYSKINLAAEEERRAVPNGGTAGPYSAREQSIREQIVRCGNRLTEEGLLQGTWGNIAVRLDETCMLCTPSGVAYHLLTPGDIVRVELSTLAYGDQRKPTSEKRLHRDLFISRPDIGAAIHTHAKLCGVFAAARRTIRCTSSEMQLKVGGEMRCAGHALPSTKRLSKVAIQALGERNGCLLMNHGVLCCGSDLEAAYQACKSAEQAAAEQLGL